MSPSTELDEVAALKARIASLEAELTERNNLADERFCALTDSAPFMIWRSGIDALRNYVNPAWLEFRGRRADQELGNGWTEGLHVDDRETCLGMYLKCFAARRAFRVRYRILNSSGSYRWVEDSGSPVLDGGCFAGFLGLTVDVHNIKAGAFMPDDQAVRLVFSLTERERQVLVLIAGGKSTKETAAQLEISYKTADSHRSRILEKLGVHETASMVRYAIRSGLIAP